MPSKQIDIKAWRLKYCPSFFRFEVNGKPAILFGPSLKMILCKYVDGDGQYINIDQNKTVRVWADSYEKAVIELIDGVVDGAIFSVQKFNGGDMQLAYYTKDGCAMGHLPIKADPQPWESEYIIKIIP